MAHASGGYGLCLEEAQLTRLPGTPGDSGVASGSVASRVEAGKGKTSPPGQRSSPRSAAQASRQRGLTPLHGARGAGGRTSPALTLSSESETLAGRGNTHPPSPLS